MVNWLNKVLKAGERIKSAIRRRATKEELSQSNVFKRFFYKVRHLDFKNLKEREINYEKFANEILTNFQIEVNLVITNIKKCLKWLENLETITLNIKDNFTNKSIQAIKKSADRSINTINSKLITILE